MTIKFRSSEDYQKVEGARKKSRPSYYNADIKDQLEISEDFEAALILIPSSARQEARQRLDAQTASTDRIQKRDGILKVALQTDAQNAEAQNSELQQKVTDLQSFKDKFASFAEVGEIGLLLRDAQIDMDELIMAADRAKNRLVCTAVLASRLGTNSVSEDIDKERKSWTNVLTEYSGV